MFSNTPRDSAAREKAESQAEDFVGFFGDCVGVEVMRARCGGSAATKLSVGPGGASAIWLALTHVLLGNGSAPRLSRLLYCKPSLDRRGLVRPGACATTVRDTTHKAALAVNARFRINSSHNGPTEDLPSHRRRCGLGRAHR